MDKNKTYQFTAQYTQVPMSLGIFLAYREQQTISIYRPNFTPFCFTKNNKLLSFPSLWQKYYIYTDNPPTPKIAYPTLLYLPHEVGSLSHVTVPHEVWSLSHVTVFTTWGGELIPCYCIYHTRWGAYPMLLYLPHEVGSLSHVTVFTAWGRELIPCYIFTAWGRELRSSCYIFTASGKGAEPMSQWGLCSV